MFQKRDREKCERLFDRYYTGRHFYDYYYRERIAHYLKPGQRVLDAGCGRYLTYCKEFSSKAEMVGIDLETNLDTDNSHQPYGVRGDVGRIPFAAESFDMIISRSVIEHLDEPIKVFREFHRVLRPGGVIILVTPNKYDYVSVIAALTPYSVHRRLASKLLCVPEDDVFPTRYRANTIHAIRKIARSIHMAATEIETINHYPAYLMFSPILFRLGVLYERVTSCGIFRSLRGSILCILEKPRVHSSQAHVASGESPVRVA